ncbi:MAG: hypothetical protein Q9222_003946 [Ikaeria aurantiellina]
MRLVITHRCKTVISFIILYLVVLQLYRYRPQTHNIFHYHFTTERPCSTLRVPSIQEPPPEAIKKWNELQSLFESHPPNLVMERGDFDGGQLADVTHDLLDNYLDMTYEEADVMREVHADMVEALPVYPEEAFRGRGIAILAGGKHSEYAATTLGMLRLVGSRLPVEVWMIDRVEAKDGWCHQLASQGMKCRFLSDYMHDMSAFSLHYQLKAPIVLFSSFAEILFLDSDSIPVVNPDHIFKAPSYMETGVVLWPDYWKATESPFTPFITGRSLEKATTAPDIQTVDSGQMLWNKEKHWKALCLSAYYNYLGPSYFYTLLTQGGPGWGDKDTFPTALRAIDANWTMIPHPLQTQRYDDGTGHGKGSGIAMLQADPTNATHFSPLFLHNNFIKLSVGRQMGDECIEDPSALSAEQRRKGEEVRFKGSIVDRQSKIWEQLNFGQRIFATKTDGRLNDMGKLDTEKDIWRVMERVGCIGVYSDEKICRRIRRHLGRTFGDVKRWDGGAERMCS